MSDGPLFDITVEPLDGSVRVRLNGELDVTSTEPFLETIRRLSSQYDATQIELDMERLDFIDLRGVDALQRAARTVRHSGRMSIHAPPPMLEVILDVIGGRERFEIAHASVGGGRGATSGSGHQSRGSAAQPRDLPAT